MNKITKYLLSAVVGVALMVGCVTSTTSKTVPVVIPTVSTNAAGVASTNYVTNLVTTTTTNKVADTNLILAVESAVLTTGTQIGVQEFLKSNPKDANYVVLIGQALNLAVANGNFNSATFSAALNTAIGKNAPSEVTGLVNTITSLYNASLAVIVANKLDSNVFVEAALRAVATGLAQ